MISRYIKVVAQVLIGAQSILSIVGPRENVKVCGSSRGKKFMDRIFVLGAKSYRFYLG